MRLENLSGGIVQTLPSISAIRRTSIGFSVTTRPSPRALARESWRSKSPPFAILLLTGVRLREAAHHDRRGMTRRTEARRHELPRRSLASRLRAIGTFMEDSTLGWRYNVARDITPFCTPTRSAGRSQSFQ